MQSNWLNRIHVEDVKTEKKRWKESAYNILRVFSEHEMLNILVRYCLHRVPLGADGCKYDCYDDDDALLRHTPTVQPPNLNQLINK